MVGSVWGFGDKEDGTVIDCIQFVEQSIGGYFIDDITEVEDRQDGQFNEGMFGSMLCCNIVLDWKCFQFYLRLKAVGGHRRRVVWH